MTNFKRIAIPLAIGACVALVSNAVAFEIIFDILSSDGIASDSITDYVGRASVSALLTLWISVMVSLYLGRDKEKQARERNVQERQLLYINKETNLPNAPWLDYVLEVKKDPFTMESVEIKTLQIHVVLWWQKIVNYLDDSEKFELMEYVKEQNFAIALSNQQLGYLGNGVFYTYDSRKSSIPVTQEYTEFNWRDYTIAFSQTSIDISKDLNSYQLANLARVLSENVERGSDYYENLGAVAKSRSTLMPDAWEAIQSGRVDFAFQPIFDLQSGDVNGFEMLARLKSESGEILLINEEVAELFESSPLSLRFHIQLLERLLKFQRRLNAVSYGMLISINVPAPILIRPAMLKEIYLCIDSGLKLKQVAFELTERTLPARSKAVKEGLYRLAGLGAKIHLDDFGAGQSSIETISAYDFDLIKLDRQFICSDLWTYEKASSLITYLRSLDTEVLVEGIEDDELADLFAKAGAQYVQGFAFAQPLTEEEALDFAQFS